MSGYRHVPVEALQQVVTRLTGGYFAMNAYADANKGTDVEKDLRHGAESLRTCMLILIGEEQTNTCIETMRKGLEAQMH